MRVSPCLLARGHREENDIWPMSPWFWGELRQSMGQLLTCQTQWASWMHGTTLEAAKLKSLSRLQWEEVKRWQLAGVAELEMRSRTLCPKCLSHYGCNFSSWGLVYGCWATACLNWASVKFARWANWWHARFRSSRIYCGVTAVTLLEFIRVLVNITYV